MHSEGRKVVGAHAKFVLRDPDRDHLRVRRAEAELRGLKTHAAERSRKATASPSRPLNGKAYPLTDHTYDVVVVGAGGAGLRATLGCAEAGLQDRLHHQGVPDPLAHGRRPGRHRRRARQHGPGRLALAHVRHRQGRRLAGRPGRHRIPVPQRARGRLRARALRRALQPHRGRPHLPAPVRRHDHRVRRRPAGAAHLRRRRPHRPRHAAHALRPVAAALGRVLHRVLRHRPDHGPGRRLPRRRRAVPRRRHACTASAPRRPSSPPAATAAPTSPAPAPTPAPATATPWCCAPACRCRTWSSCSSTRPASTAPAC